MATRRSRHAAEVAAVDGSPLPHGTHPKNKQISYDHNGKSQPTDTGRRRPRHTEPHPSTIIPPLPPHPNTPTAPFPRTRPTHIRSLPPPRGAKCACARSRRVAERALEQPVLLLEAADAELQLRHRLAHRRELRLHRLDFSLYARDPGAPRAPARRTQHAHARTQRRHSKGSGRAGKKTKKNSAQTHTRTHTQGKS